MKDISLKLLALLIGVVLVLFVNSESNSSQIGLVVPVEIGSIPEGKVILRPLSIQAQVVIKGPSFQIAQIPLSPPVIRVRVPSSGGDRFTISLVQQDFGLPPTVRIVSVEPAEFELVLDSVTSREVAVVAPHIGTLPADLALEKIFVDPEKIMVRGPSSLVLSLTRIETEPIDIREMENGQPHDVTVRSPGGQLQLGTNSVSVTAHLIPLRSLRRFDGITVEVRSSSPRRISIKPGVIDVEVAGPRDLIAALRREAVVAYIRLEEGDLPRVAKVLLDLPAGLELQSASPAELSISPKEGGRAIASRETVPTVRRPGTRLGQ